MYVANRCPDPGYQHYWPEGFGFYSSNEGRKANLLEALEAMKVEVKTDAE